MSDNEAGTSCCEFGAAKRGKAGTLSALSAAFASACCGVPLILIAFGLGGLGLGSLLGAYHWHFTAAGALLLAVAWFVFLRERANLASRGAEILNARLIPALLAVATAAVLGFGGLNVASALGVGKKAREIREAGSGSFGELAQVVLPVKGMTCVTCEWAVQKALGKLEGVVEAQASASEQRVLVRYEPGSVTLEQMIEAVDKTGYDASMPDASERPGEAR